MARWISGFLGLALLASVVPDRAIAQDVTLPSPEAVARFVQTGLDELNAPGGAVAVVDSGQIVLTRGFGRLGDDGAPVTARTPFQLASLSKTLTALIVLQLAAEGRLSIDDPVVAHLPTFTLADPDHARAITVRQLMNHTSGITGFDGNRGPGIDGADPRASELAARALHTARPFAPPGAVVRYSNANYIVLGHLVETLEQQPFEAVLEARIFSPLGMRDAFAFRPHDEIAPAARGHTQFFGFARENHYRPGRAGLAAGGISASAEDLAKYLLALSERDPRIVPPTLSRSWDDRALEGFHLGWYHLTVDGRRAILHDGLNPGFRARAMILPDERRAVFLAINLSGMLDGRLPIGAAHHALGLSPVAIAPGLGITATVWASLAGTLAFVFGCVRVLVMAFRRRHTPWTRPDALRWVLVILAPAALLAGAWALLLLVPRSLTLDLAGTRVFYPDLGALLLVMGCTAVVWALTLPILLLRRPRQGA